MTEDKARKLAELLDGEAWPSGGNIWLVSLTNTEGHYVVFSDDMVVEYKDEKHFLEGVPWEEVNILTERPKTDGFPEPTPSPRR